jgi:hypothetical protein
VKLATTNTYLRVINVSKSFVLALSNSPVNQPTLTIMKMTCDAKRRDTFAELLIEGPRNTD